MSRKNIHCLKKKQKKNLIPLTVQPLSTLGLFAYKSGKWKRYHLFHKIAMRFKLGEVI